MNSAPLKPVIPADCDTAENSSSTGYHTEQQSHLNVSRKDKFILVLSIPDILKPLLKKENRYCHGGNFDKLEMSIWGYVVPEITVPVVESRWGGQTLKFSSLARESYPAITVKFTVDNKFDNYYLLWKWLDIQNDEDNGLFNGKNLPNGKQGKLPGYSAPITVIALDEYNNPVAKWDYSGAFISSLGAIDASSRDSTELESSFTFAFSQLKMSLV